MIIALFRTLLESRWRCFARANCPHHEVRHANHGRRHKSHGQGDERHGFRGSGKDHVNVRDASGKSRRAHDDGMEAHIVAWVERLSRQTDRDRQTDRKTERQKEKQKERKKNGKKERKMERKNERKMKRKEEMKT